jgi:cytoskeletal protein CcmA (bactofilin family)
MTNLAPHSAKPSIFAGDLAIEGDIRSSGQVVFEAKIKGNITADHLVIEASGRVDGDVEARMVRVEGAVLGSLTAAEVTVAQGGQVSGSVAYGTLSVQAGATVEGDLKKVRPSGS